MNVWTLATLHALHPWRAHALVVLVVAVVCTVLYAPIFGDGLPPGVDTPTFLHFSWFVQLSLSGAPEGGLVDPFWYGGLSVFKTYPPLSYALVGALTYITHLDLSLVYKLVQLFAYIGIGVSTYWLALELRTGSFAAAIGALLAVLAYPVFTALGLWGWFTSVVALPLGIGALASLERAVRLRQPRFALLGGVLFGLAVLSHHMTAFGLALALVGWAAPQIGLRFWRRGGLISTMALFSLATAVVALWWVVPFLAHALDAGFQREVPGNWSFPLSRYIEALADMNLVGRYVYPSYFGIIHLTLAIGGIALSFLRPGRATPYGVAALVLLAFSLGDQINPLIGVRPFDGLDVARFHLFLVPFAAVLGAYYLSELLHAAHGPAAHLLPQRYTRPVLSLLAVPVLLALPAYDAAVASSKVMEPFRVATPARQALDWLAAPDREPGRVLAVGWWNWDAFLVPYYTGRGVMDGWYDEGALDWRPIREVRLMMWFGQIDTTRLYQILEERQTRYVAVYRYQMIEQPEAFAEALRRAPLLFQEVAAWEDMALFRRLPPQEQTDALSQPADS